MQDMVRVVVDAMGGDNAPGEIVKGAVEALNAREDIFIYLTGRKPVIEAELSKYTFPKERLEIVHTEEVIETAEPPVMAIRRKKDSSIVKGMNMVKQQEADAFVSAGSSGAILVGGQVIVGRIKGIERPPLAPLIPTKNGVSLLIDCGANVDARPSHLVQFAKMGSIYMEHVMGVKNPRVGHCQHRCGRRKGQCTGKRDVSTAQRMQRASILSEVWRHETFRRECADVIVCEAFVGNVILKLYEGVGATLISKVKQGMMTSSAEQDRCITGKTGIERNA